MAYNLELVPKLQINLFDDGRTTQRTSYQIGTLGNNSHTRLYHQKRNQRESNLTPEQQ